MTELPRAEQRLRTIENEKNLKKQYYLNFRSVLFEKVEQLVDSIPIDMMLTNSIYLWDPNSEETKARVRTMTHHSVILNPTIDHISINFRRKVSVRRWLLFEREYTVNQMAIHVSPGFPYPEGYNCNAIMHLPEPLMFLITDQYPEVFSEIGRGVGDFYRDYHYGTDINNLLESLSLILNVCITLKKDGRFRF